MRGMSGKWFGAGAGKELWTIGVGTGSIPGGVLSLALVAKRRGSIPCQAMLEIQYQPLLHHHFQKVMPFWSSG